MKSGKKGFMKKSGPVVGLDVGAEHIRIAQLKPSGGSFTLQKYGVTKLPAGAVIDGEFVDVETISSTIRQLTRSLGIKNADTCVGVSNQKVVVRLVDLPYMDAAEMAGAIQYQAQDYIPIPVDEAILDFQTVGDYMTSTDEHMSEVLLVAAQRDMIEMVARTVEQSKLRLSTIDVTPFAVVRGIFGIQPYQPLDMMGGMDDGAAVIHISENATNIIVVKNGVPRFTRLLGIGGKEVTQSIAASLNVTLEEADTLKTQVGLMSPGDNFYGNNMSADFMQDAQDAVARETSKFIVEIRKSLEYYLSQARGEHNISRVLLTGGGANLQNMDAYIQQQLQVPVQLADATQWINVPSGLRKIYQEDHLAATAAVGLALGAMSD